MAIDINVNQNLKGADLLTNAIELLIAKFDSFGTVLNGSDTDFRSTIQSPNKDETPQANSPGSLFKETMGKTNSEFTSLGTKISDLTKQFSEMNRRLEQASNSASSGSGAGGGSENSSSSSSEQRKRDNFIKYFATGAALAAGAEIGNFAGTLGSSAGAINSPFANYANFEAQYANKKISNLQSAGSALGTGLMGAGTMATMAGVAAGTGVGLPIAAILAGLALTSYSNYGGEQDKALNEQMRQDTLAYRLSNTGMSGMSGQKILGNVGITGVQQQGLSDQYGSYNPTLENVLFSARRDVINRSLKNGTANDFNADVNKFALLSGNQNYGQISGVASQMSAMTGESLNVVMKNMNDNFTKWGGDTAANTAKMLEIMKSTGMSQGQASDIVNRYQYNDPMLQNKVNLATANPMSVFSRALLLKNIPELAHANMQQAHSDAQNLKFNNNLVWAAMRQNLDSTVGINTYANHLADLIPNQNATGSMAPTPLQEQNMKKTSDALKNLTVDTQHVSATTVYLSGAISSNASAIANKISSVYGMPKTGASQPNKQGR